MAKKVAGTLKLQVPAGKANPSPPIGPALGQRGINIMEFCKAFNARSQDIEPGAPCPTIITYYVDKSFTMEIKTPPASHLIKKAAKLQSGSNAPGREVAGLVLFRRCFLVDAADRVPDRSSHAAGCFGYRLQLDLERVHTVRNNRRALADIHLKGR